MTETQQAQITLKRDCEAVLIPSGERTMLGAGTEVTLSQTLGGAYTVVAGHHLARIDGKDADALGMTPSPEATVPTEPQLSPEGLVREDLVWRQLKTCYDPEIPVNIVELGLIYDLAIAPHPEGGSQVEVKMTLTAPGCGMGAMIAEDVQQKVLALPGVTESKVELVWDPPWTQAMMSEAAKLELGLM
jgi:probable FeS assembly SUF system protein SufT